MKLLCGRVSMSSFYRLKLGGVFAGIVLFFLINRLFLGGPRPEDSFAIHAAKNNFITDHHYTKGIDTRNSKRDVVKVIASTPIIENELESLTEEKETNTELSADDYENYIFNVKESELQDPYVNKHKYKFIQNNKYKCDGNVYLLAVVHSAPHNQKERQDIRNTWGSVKFFSGAVIVPIFILAKSENSTLQTQVIAEGKRFRDIIQADFIDSYRNLTYKNIMGLHWIHKHCNHAKFILKTDDDTMVDMYHLINFLFQKSPDGDFEDFLYCSTFKNQGPRRTKEDKWYVSKEEYPYSKYPPYCEGFAYVMSRDVAEKLYDASVSVKPYWVDDVYATGFLALKSGIYHRNMENGHGYSLMTSQHLNKNAQTSLFLLAKYEHLRKNWNKAWSAIQAINKIGE